MNFNNFILLVLIITGFYVKSNAVVSKDGRQRESMSGRNRTSVPRTAVNRGVMPTNSVNNRYQNDGRTRSIRSYRYSSWTRRHGYAPSFRYTSTSYNYKRIGIINGLIIISDNQRSRFDVNRMSSYGSISICYNEFPLYGRNTTQSPWFMCPWNDPSHSYCCGNKFEEYCCRYFDRSGHLAGLIVGIIVLIVVFGLSYKYFCKFMQDRKDVTTKIVYKPGGPNIDVNRSAYPSDFHVYTTEVEICPLYPPSIPVNENYPEYLVSSTGFVESINENDYHPQQPSISSSFSNDNVSEYSSPQND